jgi:hypothetical protein
VRLFVVGENAVEISYCFRMAGVCASGAWGQAFVVEIGTGLLL